MASLSLPLFGLVMLVEPGAARGEGVSGAAVSGVVTRASGQPVGAALVRLVNETSGQRRETRAGADGRFLFDQLPPGMYRLDARSPGFRPASPPDVSVSPVVQCHSQR
jgi:hypothetical protein